MYSLVGNVCVDRSGVFGPIEVIAFTRADSSIYCCFVIGGVLVEVQVYGFVAPLAGDGVELVCSGFVVRLSVPLIDLTGADGHVFVFDNDIIHRYGDTYIL